MEYSYDYCLQLLNPAQLQAYIQSDFMTAMSHMTLCHVLGCRSGVLAAHIHDKHLSESAKHQLQQAYSWSRKILSLVNLEFQLLLDDTASRPRYEQTASGTL